MKKMMIAFLMMNLPIAPVLCQAAELDRGQHKMDTRETTTNWKSIRALDLAWHEQWQADEKKSSRENYITEGDSFATVILRDVPYEYQRALMLEFTRRNANLGVSAEFQRIAPEGFAVLFAKRHDRAALVTLFSRSCPETIRGVPVDVWIAGEDFASAPFTQMDLRGRPDWSGGLSNGILVLCDALDQSDVPVAKAVVARALRHAFRPHVTQVADERQLAKVCRQWFEAHRKEFYVSAGPWLPGRSSLADPRTAALFQLLGPSKK